MKKLSKVISVLLINVLLFTSSTGIVYAATSVDKELIKKGAPQNVIDLLDENTKIEIANNKSLIFGGASTMTYNESNGAFQTSNLVNINNGGATTQGQIPQADLTLTWSAWYQKNANGSLYSYSIFYDYKWNNLPLYRLQDPIGISFDGSKFRMRDNTFSKVDYYNAIYDPTTYVQSSQNQYANGSANGVSWYADLHGYQPEASALWGRGSFVIEPLTTTYSGNTTLYGHYVHSKINLGLGLNIGSIGNFSVTGTGDYDECGNQYTVYWK